ncbi:hypothetical protein ACU686_34125 [Yinghuangia aomiensis]
MGAYDFACRAWSRAGPEENPRNSAPRASDYLGGPCADRRTPRAAALAPASAYDRGKDTMGKTKPSKKAEQRISARERMAAERQRRAAAEKLAGAG